MQANLRLRRIPLPVLHIRCPTSLELCLIFIPIPRALQPGLDTTRGGTCRGRIDSVDVYNKDDISLAATGIPGSAIREGSKPHFAHRPDASMLPPAVVSRKW